MQINIEPENYFVSGSETLINLTERMFLLY